MSDYISRQAAIEMLDEQIALCDKALKSFVISMKDEYAVKVERASLVAYKEQLEVIPAANVVPVRLGEWLDGYKMQTCSLCKCRGKKSWTFCPHCGARMIYGERKENCNEADRCRRIDGESKEMVATRSMRKRRKGVPV